MRAVVFAYHNMGIAGIRALLDARLHDPDGPVPRGRPGGEPVVRFRGGVLPGAGDPGVFPEGRQRAAVAGPDPRGRARPALLLLLPVDVEEGDPRDPAAGRDEPPRLAAAEVPGKGAGQLGAREGGDGNRGDPPLHDGEARRGRYRGPGGGADRLRRHGAHAVREDGGCRFEAPRRPAPPDRGRGDPAAPERSRPRQLLRRAQARGRADRLVPAGGGDLQPRPRGHPSLPGGVRYACGGKTHGVVGDPPAGERRGACCLRGRSGFPAGRRSRWRGDASPRFPGRGGSSSKRGKGGFNWRKSNGDRGRRRGRRSSTCSPAPRTGGFHEGADPGSERVHRPSPDGQDPEGDRLEDLRDGSYPPTGWGSRRTIPGSTSSRATSRSTRSGSSTTSRRPT